MSADVHDTPKAPAAAYAIVASYLPREYFERRPPSRGHQFIVTGADNVATYWLIPPHLTVSLEQRLRAHRSIRKVHVEPFAEAAS